MPVMQRLPRRLPLPCRALLLVILAAFLLSPRAGGVSRGQEAEPAPAPPLTALLDGVPVSPEEAAALSGRLPLAVMIDNLPTGARPQIGLDRADLVYEMLVEGGITRFLAVYYRRDADRIEPVRSVRTPYVYLAAELDAVLGHVGAAEADGETDARYLLNYWGVRHLEEGLNPGAFWRDRYRAAPNNAVTSTRQLRAEAEAYGWTGPGRTALWLFKDDFAPGNQNGGPVGHVAFAFAGQFPPQYAFAVDWYWDSATNSYQRWMAGRPHADGLTGETLTAKNVIIQFDDARVAGREGYVLYSSAGEGAAFIFMDGQIIEVVWTKPGIEERTRYWNTNGEEILFNRGTTWVAVLPYGSPLEWE